MNATLLQPLQSEGFYATLLLIMSINLEEYGWNVSFALAKETSKNNKLIHGRVVSVHKLHYDVAFESGIATCDVLGTLQYQKDPLLLPAVGDWVLVDYHAKTPVVHEVLVRKSLLKRQKKHDRFPKPIAANVDYAVIIQSAEDDFNVKRIERILVHIYEAKVLPLIVINKIDLVNESIRTEIQKTLRSIHVPIFYTSAKTQESVNDFISTLQAEKTYVFIGSSGVGKSTLLNLIHGEEIQKTQEITEKTGKGKHTTTARKLVRTESGILIIDTPGTREFGMYSEDTAAIEESFSDIESIIELCRFSDCGHQNEPGCAIQKALAEGILSLEKFERYQELLKEQSQSAKQMRQDERSSGRRRIEQPVRSVRRGKNKPKKK
jgi:ribosome biogenesis GTPase / thiamine phosphate phosphatase